MPEKSHNIQYDKFRVDKIMFTIVGVKEYSGTYQGKPYLFYRAYYELEPDQNQKGSCYTFVKISNRLAQEIVHDEDLHDIFDLVGMTIKNIYYNAYQQPSKIDFA